MVTELQFVAIAAFLIWCLISSLCGLLNPEPDAARLVWRQHGATGWGNWREVHFGLTAADQRVLSQPEPVLDRAARDALLTTVRQQDRHPDTDAFSSRSCGSHPSAIRPRPCLSRTTSPSHRPTRLSG